MDKKVGKILQLDGKKTLILIAAEILSMVLHNVVYALTGVEEAIFFLLAVLIIPIFFLIALFYSLGQRFLKKKS